MANAAWAFVRPMEITKGALAAIELENKQAANDIALQEARNNMAINAELRPMQLQAEQLRLQSAGLGLQNLQNTAATNTETFQNNQWALAAKKALQVDQAPGESESSVYKKMLASVTNIQDPNIKYQATQMLNQQAQALALQALNRGDPTAAQDILLGQNNGPIPTNIASLPPQQQLNLVTNNQLVGQLPNAKMAEQAALENLKTMNDIRLRGVPTADNTARLAMDEANRGGAPTTQQIVTGYTAYLTEATKQGITPMSYVQWAQQFTTTQRQPVNSVRTAPTPGVSPTGVPNR
jgi:hypothetical protein